MPQATASLNPLQSIFGGTSTSTTQQSSGQGTTTASNYNPLTAYLSTPGTILNMAQNNAPTYTGQLTPTGTAAQNTTLNTLGAAVAPNNNVNSYINQVLSGYYMPGQPGGNAMLSPTIAAAQTPTNEGLQNTLQIGDPDLFAAAGHQVQGAGDSAFQTANAIATESADNADAQIATQLGTDAYNQGITQMTAAAALQPQEIQATINTLQAQLLPTLLQEQGITNGLSAFQDNVTSLTSVLQTLAGLSTPVLGSNTQYTNQSSEQSTSNTQTSPFAALFPTTGAGGTGGVNSLLNTIGA